MTWLRPRPYPLRLTELPFSPPLVQAPMEGVTNFQVRNAFARLGGVGLLTTEFVRVSSGALTEKVMRRHVLKTPGVPLAVQIMGNEPDFMAESARIAAACGADVVDVNLGCPTKRALKGNVGAAMLRDPELCHRVLAAMREQVPGLFSAKIRAGFEETEHVLAIADAIRASGVDFLTVHPRRRKDGFREGTCDWRIIGLLAEKLDLPVIGNGDVWCATDARRMMQETGCAAVMIGRGAMRNPFIFRQSAALLRGDEPEKPDLAVLLAWYHQLAAECLEAFGGHEGGTLARLKEALVYLSASVRDGIPWRSAMVRSTRLEECFDHLERLVAERPLEDFDLCAERAPWAKNPGGPDCSE